MSCALLLSVNGFGQDNNFINGKTVDGVTKEPLPFVHIVVKGSNRGLMSNDEGAFQMTVDEQMKSDTLIFSCIGYELFELAVPSFQKSPDSTVELRPKSFELNEVVVFPLSPEEYIRRAVEKIPANYSEAPVLSSGYYAELTSENKQFLKFEEAVTDTWVPAVGDTGKAHSSVRYARLTRDIETIQFMKEHRERKAKKRARKAAKNDNGSVNEEVSDEMNASIVSSNFGGPSETLTSDPVRDHEPFMQPEHFKKFRYRFEPQVAFGDRKLMVIGFEHRRKIDYTSSDGKIYIDQKSDAIVAVEYSGKFHVPLLLEPVLFALGYGISNPEFSVIVHYREHAGRWHVSSLHKEIEIELTKKYMWRKNDHAIYDIEQSYVVHELTTANVVPIDPSIRMKPDQLLTEQAQFKDESFWETYTVVRPQKIEHYLNQ